MGVVAQGVSLRAEQPGRLYRAAKAPAQLDDLPGDQFTRRQDFEQSFRRLALDELLERSKPDFDALADRQALPGES